LQTLRDAYLNAKTPEEAASAAQKLNALQGKIQQDEYMTAGGGETLDARGNLIRSPDQIINKRTGQPVSGQAAQKAQPPTPGMVKNGYRFKGGDPANQASWEKV